MTDAANRDPGCLFHHIHVLSFAFEQSHLVFPPCRHPVSEWDSSVVLSSSSLGKPLVLDVSLLGSSDPL
jgi:hypothetical protein